MASANKCHGSMIIYGSCRLLPKINKGVFKYFKPNHLIAKEMSEIRLDPKM
jgi:hypothetical protein